MQIPPRTDDRNSRETVTVPRLSRAEFLEMFRENYHSGHHATFLGPTRRGKTTLCIQCVNEVASPERPVTILAGKPPGRDPRMAQAAKELDLDVTEEWPPEWSSKHSRRFAKLGRQQKRGYVLRPKHDMDDDAKTEANLRRQFGAALTKNYASKTPNITVVDEGHHVSQELKLRGKMDSILMRGAPVASLFVLVQRGRYMSYHIYGAPEHVFIFYDPDRDNRQRYSDLGGVDPAQVRAITDGLKTYTEHTEGATISECLYIRRSGNEMYVIDVQ